MIHAPIKALVLGATGAGKTGMLPSLITAGFNVRILDGDNGAKLVRSLIAPEHADRLSVITLTEKMTPVNGLVYPLSPTGWVRATSALRNWKDDNGRELGSPTTWTTNDVLVVDTLTTIAKMAYWFTRKMNSRESAPESGKLWQSDIGNAQSLTLALLDMLRGTDIPCNVIVNCHIARTDEDGGRPTDLELEKARVEKRIIRLNGYPEAIGTKKSPKIPVLFSDMLYLKRDGANATLWTQPVDGIDVKNSAPTHVKRSYKHPTALLDFFTDVRAAEEAK